jgi:hypothetical protein
MAMKPKAPKPMGSGKKKPGRKTPGVKVLGKPVPLATYKPKRAPGSPVPVPMPKRVPNLSLPPDQRTKAIPTTPGPKVKTFRPKVNLKPGTPTKKQISEKIPTIKKKPKLDDFLLKGKRPPMKIKPGLKRPSDADVILKGYNDKKYKKGK